MSTPFAPGLYHTAAPAESVSGDWRLAGWNPAVLRITEPLGEQPRREVLEEIAGSLRLPDGAAASLDALAVALARVSNTVLIWEHGQAFADAHGALWKAVSEVLVARTKQPGFAVVLAGAPNKKRR